ncbi:hypothetical protein [Lentiprolixibacter aurantiacus]|uniref:Uncharacterized protein n=1 Tax=Lentiprolixibacter aurantiacus TaxID=2993939 RepID=A0AAE3MMW6_9FLAO|nr:hypothetical protein [Lentiprolixibacter aurantiacus]MCX2720710.1 hypothetical protein [Lentiprolixibacter aurantiacus]
MTKYSELKTSAAGKIVVIALVTFTMALLGYYVGQAMFYLFN